MQKRGSHIDVVLSFVIFVFVLVFIISMLTPKMEPSKQKLVLIDLIKDLIVENSSSYLITFSIQITDTINKDCVKITQNFADEITEENINETKLIIKNETNILEYDLQEDFLLIRTGTGPSGFLKFYYSENLNSSYCPGCITPACTPINNYEVGITRKNYLIFISKIEELANKYNTDYENLRNELKLPPETEFAFTFEFDNGDKIVAEKNIPETVDVYVKEIPVLYMGQGNILTGNLIIKVW